MPGMGAARAWPSCSAVCAVRSDAGGAGARPSTPTHSRDALSDEDEGDRRVPRSGLPWLCARTTYAMSDRGAGLLCHRHEVLMETQAPWTFPLQP